MKAPLREQLRAQSLPEDELSEAEQQLLRAVLDQELQAKWAQALAEKGVHRDAPKSRLSMLRPWLAVAATILLLAVAGWWFWSSPAPDGNQLLADEIGQLDAVSSVERSGNTQADSLRNRIATAYSNDSLQKALSGISVFIIDGTATVEDYVFAGICYLQSPEPDYAAAINAFLEARKFNSGRYNDDLYWYLGLAYGANGEKEKAIEELRPLVTGGKRKASEAAALIEALD